MTKQEILIRIQNCIDELAAVSFHTKHTQEAYSQVSNVKAKLALLYNLISDSETIN